MSKKLKLFLYASFIILAGSIALATSPEKKPGMRHISEDVPIDAPGYEQYRALTRIPFGQQTPGIEYTANCTDINPQGVTIIRNDQVGSTWYDMQKNGSMGRMISVTSGGYRHFSWMHTDGIYPSVARHVNANCYDPSGGGSYIGEVHADSLNNAGYSNQTNLSNGISVTVEHRTSGSPVWGSTLTMADNLASTLFSRHWNIPDSIRGSTYQGVWPKAEVLYDNVAGRDNIHIVMTEGNTTGGVPVMVAYERCYLGTNDTLVCQCYRDGATRTYQIYKNVNGPGGSIGHFDSSFSITPVVAVSPTSQRVAIAYMKPADPAGSFDYLSDVCYIESMNNGDDWIAGTPWPPSPYNTTSFGLTGYERGLYDLNACYDYQDSLHIVYETVGFDPANPGYYYPGLVRLYHWSKATGVVPIDSAIQQFTIPNPGAHNLSMAKMSISAMDPIYHPGGAPDSVYLYCIWTQFDTADNAANGYSNGDIYGAGSPDGGASWRPAHNLTNTKTPNCAAGNCLSEHWSSLARNMYNGNLHIQYICDRDAGAANQDAGSTWMDNPVMYLELQAWNLQSPYLDDGITITAYSPVDLIVTDPIGDSISLWFNTIPGASYDTTTDYDLDGDKDDIVTIPNRLVGDYLIEVVAEAGGSGTYDLGIRIDGGAPAMLAMGQPCPGSGEVDSFNYDAPWYKTGDANGDWNLDVGDVVYLINYLYKGGVFPEPLVSGDATCDEIVDVGDVVYLINYLFKGGPAPSC